jgi:putative ABC transport system permease protein
MLINYFRVAFRNFWKHRTYSFLNIMGLTIGITACYLIFLYVRFEKNYDSFNTKADRIYRLVTDLKLPADNFKTWGTSAPMGINIQTDFPQVESAVRLYPDNLLVRHGDIMFQEQHSFYADSTLFGIFDFPFVHGDPHTALREPNSIVLSQTTAHKYFGDTDPVGQHLLLTTEKFNATATVTGVMKDIPANSQIKADMFVSMSTKKRIDSAMDRFWSSFGYTSYLLLKPHTNAAALEAGFVPFLQRRVGEEMEKNQMFFTLFLEPLKDVYLHSKRGGQETGNITNVYIFSIIAGFILLIACINFINLTTARSTERAKEVGIRKVIGAARSGLTWQFLGDSVLLCWVAFALCLLLCQPLFPLFNQLAGKTIITNIAGHWEDVAGLFALATGIGILAGLYPALMLSSFKPITVLKGRFAAGTRGLVLRRGLVVTQFTVSITLIVATFIVYTQLHYMRSQELGFNNEQMMVLDTHGNAHKDLLRQEIAAIPGVRSITASSSIPGSSNLDAYSQIENKKGDMQIAPMDLYYVDFNYIGQYKMKLAAGRDFSRQFSTDTTQAMILNESAVRLLGYTKASEAIGRHFAQWGREGLIIGVVKDFHFRALQKAIMPMSMRIEPSGCNLLSVNVNTSDVPALVAAIGDKWKKAIPDRPFSYYFADEYFDKQYRSEEHFGKLFINFAVLAIFISCLGLLGLASYSTLQRTKEIGIRKVLGASVTGIIHLLSKEFLQLIAIAFLIATPIAWYLMYQWLKDFAYRTHISWWMFALPGLMALLIALCTISLQAIKAAIANPVRSLRAE